MTRPPQLPSQQTGMIAFFVAVMLFAAVATSIPLLLSSLPKYREAQTQHALSQARQALLDYIGGGITQTGKLSHPGDPLRPDTFFNGAPDGEADSQKTSGGIINWRDLCTTLPITSTPAWCLGYVPTKSLGLPRSLTDLADVNGQNIWYALPAAYVKNTAPTLKALHQMAANNLLISLEYPSAPHLNIPHVMSVLMIPNKRLPHQHREPPQNITATALFQFAQNYLESLPPTLDTLVFTLPSPSSRHDDPSKLTHNDLLTWITLDDVSVALTQRMARELAQNWTRFDLDATAQAQCNPTIQCAPLPTNPTSPQCDAAAFPAGQLPQTLDVLKTRTQHWSRCYTPERTWLNKWRDDLSVLEVIAPDRIRIGFLHCDHIRYLWQRTANGIHITQEGRSCAHPS